MKTITIDGIEYQLTPIATEAPKPVQWAPERLDKNQRYWFIDSKGSPYKANEDLLPTDIERVSFGNYFHTEKEADEVAKQVRQLLRLRAYVREFAPDYKPDWGDDNQDKWYVYFDEGYRWWDCSCNKVVHNVTTVYMPKNVVEDLIRKLNSGEVVL